MSKGTLKFAIIGAAFLALAGVSASAAIASKDGIAIEAGGMKISVDLSMTQGAKLIFRRAG